MATMIVDEGKRNLFVWKCSTEDFMYGTQLVVHESQMAIFFRDGSIVEVLKSGRHILVNEYHLFALYKRHNILSIFVYNNFRGVLEILMYLLK